MRHPILLTAALAFLAASLEAQLAQPPAGITEGVLADLANRCPANPALGSPESSPSWSGWGGGANNARYQTAANSGISAADVPKLKLKWAFGIPGGASMYSQPAVAFGRVFVGGD